MLCYTQLSFTKRPGPTRLHLFIMIAIFGNVLHVPINCCVAIFSSISSILSISFNLSFFIGQLIVKVGGALVSLLVDFVVTLQALLQVLTEDYLLFLSDVTSALSNVLLTGFDVFNGLDHFVRCAVYYVFSSAEQFVQGVLSFLSFFISSDKIIFSYIFSAIHQCLLLIKNSLVLLGQTSWDLFAFFPRQVVVLKRVIVSSAVQTMVNVRDGVSCLRFKLHQGLYETILFMSDIPRESFYGLSIFVLVAFFYIKYHRSIHPVLVRNVIYALSQCQRTLITAWTYLEAFTFWLLTNQMTPSLNGARHHAAQTGTNAQADDDQENEEQPDRRDEATENHAGPFERKLPSDPEDRLCVVCQDSERCTIILPCRHVCLCYECCATIKRTQGRCPVCRHVVRRTMRVYI